MKFLIVDDDDVALDLLSTALRGAGYSDVTAAKTGVEALQIVNNSEKPFSVFLLDIRMPGMDGIELCARLRAMSAYRAAPIVMITAMQERHFIDSAFAAGATDYINKPFDPLELSVRVGIASRLSRDARRVDEYATEVAMIRARTGVDADFSLDEAITISDVPRVISITAMENYLLRLSYLMTVKSKSVAFSIQGFDTLHAYTRSSDLYDVLSDTAHAITNGLKHTHHLLTYVGHGQFVAVISGRGARLDEETLWMIQSELEQEPPLLSSGALCPIRLSMSKVYLPLLWPSANRLNLLLSPQSSTFSLGENTAHHIQAA